MSFLSQVLVGLVLEQVFLGDAGRYRLLGHDYDRLVDWAALATAL